ncbi:MAG: hypothetical protein IKZ46_18065 [Victivallales bacterium]|nr:hypothetical protein [Victivallales bacterium]
MKDNNTDMKTEAEPKNDTEMKNKDVVKQGCLGTVIAVFILFFVCAICAISRGPWAMLAFFTLPFRLGDWVIAHQVDFRGRLLDQNGQPVQLATIQYEISSSMNYRAGKVESNNDGVFEIHEGKGNTLYIKDVDKRGYAFRGWEQKDYFGGIEISREHVATSEPVVFHLRKKHAEAVVLGDIKAGISFNDSMKEKWLGKDMARNCTGTPEWMAKYLPRGSTGSSKNIKPMLNDKPVFWDYEATGENHPEKQEWVIHIRMNGENAGILLGDEKLYEAPAEGYAKEIVLTVKYSGRHSYSYGDKTIDKEVEELFQMYPKYLYLRLRNPGMYARLDLRHANATGENIYLEFEGVVNPYGSRSLEPLLFSDEEYKRANECDREGMKALKEQRLALRPPFEQWIDEGKAFY